jgi:hypothetical protein
MDEPQLPAEIITGRSLDETPRPDFAIAVGDIETATWAFAKLNLAAETLAGIRRQAASWRERVTAWEQAASRPLEATIIFFEERLAAWALAEREASPKTKRGEPTVKTVLTPLGRVETRKGTMPTVVLDEEKLVAWCQANMPDAVKTTYKPLLPVLREHCAVRAEPGVVYAKLVTPAGEVVPGVAVEINAAVATVRPER